MLLPRLSLILLLFSEAVAAGQSSGQVPPHSFTESLVVSLPGFGRFQGTIIVKDLLNATTLAKPVDAWLGVEYSTQPVGEGRFRPVARPHAFAGVKHATSYGPACHQNAYGSLVQSEACLTLNLFRPSGIPRAKKLPVFVYLHGGSFVWGDGRSFDGPAFVAKSAEPLIVVTAQYRLGALGGIPSKLMEEEGLLNLGLRDQRQMLEFLQEYVDNFGGDNEQVTLGGLSAGGHSVGFHLFHNYGADQGKPLFSKAILISGSPTARAFPGTEYPLYQRQFQDFVDYVGCPAGPNSAVLTCLRRASSKKIQFVSSAIYAASDHNITWPWQPVSPGPLLEKRGSVSGNDGTFFQIPMLISSVTDEGSRFVPLDLHTNADFLAFWRALTPGLGFNDLADLQRLYLDPNTYGDLSPYKPQAGRFVSTQFQRVSAAYGDYSYTCPVQDTALRLAETGSLVYKAHFNTPDNSPTYLGIPHASDERYYNGLTGTRYPAVADIYSSYFASFIISGDPNTHAHADAPRWDVYNQTMGRQLVVSTPHGGGVRMEPESVGIRAEQCRWWRDKDRSLRLNK